jgi:hypothetical protein
MLWGDNAVDLIVFIESRTAERDRWGGFFTYHNNKKSGVGKVYENRMSRMQIFGRCGYRQDPSCRDKC